MLGQVPGDNHDQLLEPVKVRDLSTRTYHISIYYTDQPKLLEELDSPPECSFRAAGELRDLGLFRVDFAVVDPQSEETESNFTLAGGHTQGILETVTDPVVLLKKQGGRQHTE